MSSEHTPDHLGPRVESEGSYLDCGFTAKQWPPSAEAVAAGDTEHWYIILEPEAGADSPISDLIPSLIPRDDSYESTSEIARFLDKRVKGLNVTVLRRPGAAHN